MELQYFVEVVYAVAHREGVVLRRVLRIVVLERHRVAFVHCDSVRCKVVVRYVRAEIYSRLGFVKAQDCCEEIDVPVLWRGKRFPADRRGSKASCCSNDQRIVRWTPLGCFVLTRRF